MEVIHRTWVSQMLSESDRFKSGQTFLNRNKHENHRLSINGHFKWSKDRDEISRQREDANLQEPNNESAMGPLDASQLGGLLLDDLPGEKKRQGTPSMFFGLRSFRPRPLLACTASPSSRQFHAVALRSTSPASDLPILRSSVRLDATIVASVFSAPAGPQWPVFFAAVGGQHLHNPSPNRMSIKQKANGAGAVRICDSVPAASTGENKERKGEREWRQ